VKDIFSFSKKKRIIYPKLFILYFKLNRIPKKIVTITLYLFYKKSCILGNSRIVTKKWKNSNPDFKF
jgi:hypothetical protein